MTGIVIVNKKVNVTSNDVVVKIKHLLNEKKVGHLGTLDPLASGVLPVAIGRATRLFDYFLDKKKTYKARFKFGVQTDTLDLEGKVIKKSQVIPTLEQIKKAIKENFLGKIMQVPPLHSSKKVNGKRAYELARHGEEVELKPSEKTIYKFECLREVDKYTFEFEIVCSSGTYIRSLARDLGEKTGSCATMTSLIRTKSGEFKLEDGINFEELNVESIKKSLIPVERCLDELEKITVSERQYKNLRDGKKIFVDNLSNKKYLVFCEKKCVGIGEIRENALKMLTYLI